MLVEVTPADGWSYDIDDDDPDEIEVDFHRDTIEREIEIEWEHGQLEIEIDSDVEPAEPGVYELGAAGSFEFRHTDGRLELADVVVADGWDLHIDEEDADEIEFTLRSGPESWDVEIELDDGQVELEIDYEVETTIER